MRLLPFFILVLAGALGAAESMPPFVYPFWNGSETIADYAKRVNLPPTQSLDLSNGVKMDLVLIPAGKFIMGTPEHEKPDVGLTMVCASGGILFVVMMVLLICARRQRKRLQFSMAFMLLMTFVASIGVWGGVRWYEALKHPFSFPQEQPAHPVTLAHPFYMEKYEVTQAQWQAVMGSNPSHFRGRSNPVENVSWDDIQGFLGQAGYEIKLPTEAQWEWACRAGTKTRFYTGDSDADLARAGWYGTYLTPKGNSGESTNTVKQKQANAWGLYDMHGNVWEWCADWYGAYPTRAVKDPTGADSGSYRVLRGGSWCNSPEYCHSASRLGRLPDDRRRNYGFRVVMRVSSRTP